MAVSPCGGVGAVFLDPPLISGAPAFSGTTPCGICWLAACRSSPVRNLSRTIR